MKIVNLKTNQHVQPLGFELETVALSYQVLGCEGRSQEKARIEVALDMAFGHLVYDSGFRTDINNCHFPLNIELQPCTRYYWRVSVVTDQNETLQSEVCWFETAKMNTPWQAKWITTTDSDAQAQRFFTSFEVDNKAIARVRGYFCGLGLYELSLDDVKVSDEFFAPGCTAYDRWIQYQTYDLTEYVTTGVNRISILTGNGWYKGRFGFENDGTVNTYGDKLTVLGEVVVEFEDGSTQLIMTDDSWQCDASCVATNGIYDGEVVDTCRNLNAESVVYADQDLTKRLSARRSPPVKVNERIAPKQILSYDDGSYVLDFGKNLVGWVEMSHQLPSGHEIELLHFEALNKEGYPYVGNLKGANPRFIYIANGQKVTCRPHFSYFGFRYVKVMGLAARIDEVKFEACFIHTDIRRISEIETANPLVNQLVENVFCSQMGNFLDVPTDCPQRDERMGWTGDIQIFAPTACHNSDNYAFLSKYLYDLQQEQQKLNGSVPFVVPTFSVKGHGSCAWGDAATLIPWVMWQHSGDPTILVQQYASMKAWVDYIDGQVAKQPGSDHLWRSGFHFGDWLALDNEAHIKSFKGRTEDTFIASCYFYISALTLSRAAQVLGKIDEESHYLALSQQVLQDIRVEYLTPGGRLGLETQTAYVLAIVYDIYPPQWLERGGKDLFARLKRDQFKLKTGFVGTPHLCAALSKAGQHDLAFKLFTSESKPGWLYPVTQGATSIWERWDSIDEEGNFHADAHMNSLNHYALGSVLNWFYEDVCGLRTMDSSPGFKRAAISPKPNFRLNRVCLRSIKAAGEYRISYEISPAGALEFAIKVPFDCYAVINLPDVKPEDIIRLSECGRMLEHNETELSIAVKAGDYRFTYMPSRDYLPGYSLSMSLKELRTNQECRLLLERKIPDVINLPFIHNLENEAVEDLLAKPFSNYSSDVIDDLNQRLSKIKLEV